MSRGFERRTLRPFGPGSGRADYAAVGIPFAEQWSRFADSAAEAERLLCDVLAPALGRGPADLGHLPVGPPEHCARVLADYAAAGARRVLLWPLRDGVRQLLRCAEEVAPHLPR